MLRNKWLALGLSLLAVVLIVYRVFFDQEKMSPPASSAQPLVPSVPPDDPEAHSPEPNLEWTDPSGDLLLDLDSPLLMRRVHPSAELFEPYTPLSSRFGLDIFVRTRESEPEKKEGELTEPERLELNGIVIERDRRLAIVNRQLVKEGEYVGAALVVRIEPGRVLCRIEGTDIVLESSHLPLKRLDDGG